METYIVLRDVQRTMPGDPFGTGTRGLAPPEPRIETETTDARGRRELLGDPGVVGVCPSIPTKIVEPPITEPDTARDTGMAWGIGAVGADTTPSPA